MKKVIELTEEEMRYIAFHMVKAMNSVDHRRGLDDIGLMAHEEFRKAELICRKMGHDPKRGQP